jgi:hypothetical protein
MPIIDVAVRLRRPSLRKYEAAFRDNDLTSFRKVAVVPKPIIVP